MSTDKQALKCRIRIMSRIYDIDLPQFLMEYIDFCLCQYIIFKLVNVENNIEQFVRELVSIRSQYIRWLINFDWSEYEKDRWSKYYPFLTNDMFENNYRPRCSVAEVDDQKNIRAIKTYIAVVESAMQKNSFTSSWLRDATNNKILSK